MSESLKSINKNKKNYNRNAKKKIYLEAGIKGYFCTCNFREKDCVRESYNLLNEYADKVFGPENTKPVSGDTKTEDVEQEAGDENDDITDILQKELSEIKGAQKNLKLRRFQAVETGAANCIFIRTTLQDHDQLVSEIINDLIESKSQKTRYLLRIMPIMATCRTNVKDIVDTAGPIFDKYFLKEPTTFSIIFNRRYNNSLSRDDIIKELAELITMKNSGNKADLKKPKLAVIVEIIKGICLLSVLPNYYEHKKYNLFELCKPEETAGAVDKPEEDAELVVKVPKPMETIEDLKPGTTPDSGKIII